MWTCWSTLQKCPSGCGTQLWEPAVCVCLLATKLVVRTMKENAQWERAAGSRQLSGWGLVWLRHLPASPSLPCLWHNSCQCRLAAKDHDP